MLQRRSTEITSTHSRKIRNTQRCFEFLNISFVCLKLNTPRCNTGYCYNNTRVDVKQTTDMICFHELVGKDTDFGKTRKVKCKISLTKERNFELRTGFPSYGVLHLPAHSVLAMNPPSKTQKIKHSGLNCGAVW